MTCYGLNNLMRQDLVNPNQSLTCGLNQNYGSQGFLQGLLNGTYSGCGYYGNSGYYNPTYTSYFPGQMNLGFNAGASVANYVCSLGNMIVTSISNNRKENASATVDQDLEDIDKDIESGQELFLPVTIRQKLARVLKCSPEEIKKYEREYQFEVVPFETIEELKSKILKRETNLRCPLCGEPLITRIAKMQDLEDNLIYQPKAHCVKCVFQIKE